MLLDHENGTIGIYKMSEYQVYIRKRGHMVQHGAPHPARYIAEHAIRKYLYERYGGTVSITPICNRTKFLNSVSGVVLAEIVELNGVYTHKNLERIIKQKVKEYAHRR